MLTEIQTCKWMYKAHMTKPLEDETDNKEHSKSQNEQHVIQSYQNNRPVNLSAYVQQDVSNFLRFHFIGFMFHGFLGRQ